MKSEVV